MTGTLFAFTRGDSKGNRLREDIRQMLSKENIKKVLAAAWKEMKKTSPREIFLFHAISSSQKKTKQKQIQKTYLFL